MLRGALFCRCEENVFHFVYYFLLFLNFKMREKDLNFRLALFKIMSLVALPLAYPALLLLLNSLILVQY